MSISTDKSSSLFSRLSEQHSRSSPECSYDAISGSVSLLDDHALAVRQRAASFIATHARDLRCLPPNLIERLLLDPDNIVVRTIIESIPLMTCNTGVAIPTLIYTLADARPGVAVAAARSLGTLGAKARSAFIPMQVLSLTVGDESIDPRVPAFEQALPEEARIQYALIGEHLRKTIREGFRQLYDHLRGILCSPSDRLVQLDGAPLVIGMCLGSEKMRHRALRVVVKHGDVINRDELAAQCIEGALAFISPEMGRTFTSSTTKTNFLYACCQTRPHNGLEYVVSRLEMNSDDNVDLLRDYTGAYLSEGQVCESTVRRMCDAMWAPECSTVRAAATNLGALADRFPRQVTLEVLDRIFEVLVLRADEQTDVTSGLVAAVSYISQYDREILERCSNVAAAKLGSRTNTAVAQILQKVQFSSSDLQHRARTIIRYLLGFDFSQV